MRLQNNCWLLALLLLVGGGISGVAAQSDPGRHLEAEFGVLSRDTADGRKFNDQLDRVVKRMTDATGYELKSATVLGGRSADRDKVMNAFALPDGRIYITLGLLRALEEAEHADAELAFVVGHEMIHVVEKHGRQRQRQSLTAGILAAIIGLTTRDSTISELANLGAAAYVTRFNRRDEYAADRGGLKAMHQAGYPLSAAPSMLERLQGAGKDQSRFINGLFGTHPLTENRIKQINELIEEIEGGSGGPRS